MGREAVLRGKVHWCHGDFLNTSCRRQYVQPQSSGRRQRHGEIKCWKWKFQDYSDWSNLRESCCDWAKWWGHKEFTVIGWICVSWCKLNRREHLEGLVVHRVMLCWTRVESCAHSATETLSSTGENSHQEQVGAGSSAAHLHCTLFLLPAARTLLWNCCSCLPW